MEPPDDPGGGDADDCVYERQEEAGEAAAFGVDQRHRHYDRRQLVEQTHAQPLQCSAGQ